MIALPFAAAKLFLKSPRLLALGFFPGIFTFALAMGAAYLAATKGALPVYGPWVATAAALLVFLLAWLALARVSLLPVEDAIIDQVQIARCGRVILPGHGWGVAAVFRKTGVALLLGGLGLLSFLLSFFPWLSVLAVVLAGWLSAYGFLEAAYERKAPAFGPKLALFFEDAAANLLLGLFINTLLFVPFVNVFLLGYAQVLATLVALRRELAANRDRT